MSFWNTVDTTARVGSGKPLAEVGVEQEQTPLQRALVRASLPGAHETAQDLVEEAVRLGMLAGAEGRAVADGMALDRDLSYASESIARRVVGSLRG